MDAGNVEGSVDGAETDYDGDGTNDFEDDDDDDDGKLDTVDDCPRGERNWTSNGNTDHDGDGCKDISLEDLDDDNDGVLDINDNCSRGETGWISNDTNDIDNDGCSATEDTDLDGDLIPNEAQPYFSQGYKLLAANARSLCGLHEADLIHCIAQDNPRLTDVERPYVITPLDQIDLTSDTFVALEGNRVVCEEQFEEICPSTELKYIAQSHTACGISMGTETIDRLIVCWLPAITVPARCWWATTGDYKQVWQQYGVCIKR